MRPSFWHPPVELSPTEQTIVTRIKCAKLFVFLRDHRHILFDNAFQEELAALDAPSLRGHPPIPPAQLALALILQAYTGCIGYLDHPFKKQARPDGERTPFPACKHRRVGVESDVVTSILMLARHYSHGMEKLLVWVVFSPLSSG